MSERFVDSPNLFGVSGSGTHGEIKCDLCGTVYHKGADDNEDYDNDGVCETTFAGLTVVECCFGKLEHEVFNRMDAILPWYKKILDERGIRLRKQCESYESLFEKEPEQFTFESDEEYEKVDLDTILNYGDYVEGVECVGYGVKRRMRGWVDKIYTRDGEIIVDIQCDDKYGGRRGNSLHGSFGMRVLRTKKLRPVIEI